MGTTLVINPGSSSKKYALYEEGRSICVLRYERSGDNHIRCVDMATGVQDCSPVSAQEYADALRGTLRYLTHKEVIKSLKSIEVVGVRVVAPGTFFQHHRKVDENYLSILKERIPAAPLHIPHILEELQIVQQELPNTPIIGVSDSSFHSTMPEITRRYSIDAEDADRYDLYRFGYHGLSVSSIVSRAHTILGEDPSRMIVVHVGSGVSITALKDGKTLDTSMGYAPGSGVVMGSRAGDIEPGALLELMRRKHFRHHDMHMYLQTNGGLQALAGETDLRMIMQRWVQGDKVAALAFHKFLHHIQKTIGGYIAVLGGVDAIVLTATAVERNFELRQQLLGKFDFLGVQIDEDKNDQLANSEGIISTTDSKVKVAVMRTNEMHIIYHTAQTVLSSLGDTAE